MKGMMYIIFGFRFCNPGFYYLRKNNGTKVQEGASPDPALKGWAIIARLIAPPRWDTGWRNVLT
jgi:hypothetical protein